MANQLSLADDGEPHTIGPIWLSPGVRPWHAVIPFFFGALGIILASTANTDEPELKK